MVDLRGGRRSDLAAAIVGAGLRLETIMPTQQLEDAFLHLLEAPTHTSESGSEDRTTPQP